MSTQSKLCQSAPRCCLFFSCHPSPSNEQADTEHQIAGRSQVWRSQTHEDQSPLPPAPPRRRLTFPLQSPRSAALVLPRICSIHRHLGIGCDFRRGFICTLTSITSFSSVTVCFALNLLLFSFTPRFALFQSLLFIARSAQWGAQQSGSTDTRECKSISFLLPFYHLCPFFVFLLRIPPFLSFALFF